MLRLRIVPILVGLFGLVWLVDACTFLGDQIHIASTSSCVQKACGGEPDSPGYQRCEAACRTTYAR